MSATLIARQKVSEYEAWRKVYNHADTIRDRHGCTGMSVVVMVRFPTDDPGRALEWVRSHPDIPEEITLYGKTLGQIGHRFLLAEKELIVIDEWPNEESFHTFFSNAPRMQEFIAGAGLPSDPVISIHQAAEAPGTFWT